MKHFIRILIGKLFVVFEYCHWYYQTNQYRQKYDISPEFIFNGNNIRLYGQGTMEFGPKSYVGDRSAWQASKGYKIKIGKGCKISHNVRVYTSTAIADSDFSTLPIPSKKGDVSIGNYVWIGANVMINPGITIGDNAIVGANSVVTKDIPTNAIYGGVPAKLIRMKKGC